MLFPGDPVTIMGCRAVHPPAESVTLSTHWLKGSHPSPDLQILSEIFKTNFLSHVMMTGQSFILFYEGQTVVLKVKNVNNLTVGRSTKITITWN